MIERRTATPVTTPHTMAAMELDDNPVALSSAAPSAEESGKIVLAEQDAATTEGRIVKPPSPQDCRT